MPKPSSDNPDMDCAYSKLLDSALEWASTVREAGWFSSGDIERLNRLDLRNPATLFDDKKQRPLVVAFFGGTGVGKSTLLNRLSGRDIAKTGVERPTSREVSVYLHDSLNIDHLPTNFPMEKVRIAYHENDRLDGIIWIDMPDIDSTERNNRQIVLDWLPHVDVVLYIVSPERYRDEKGWRLLLSKGLKHAWLFIMNHWDKGESSQIDAFQHQLTTAGFHDPIILRTDSKKSATGQDRAADDFGRLQEIISSLANTHTIKQLQTRGMEIRMTELQNAIRRCTSNLGDKEVDTHLNARWEEIWRDTTHDLEQGLQWPIQQLAQSYGDRAGSLIRQFKKETDNNGTSEGKKNSKTVLWDDWAQTRFNDGIDQLIVEAGAKALPLSPFKSSLNGLREKAITIVYSQGEQCLRQALANPGNAVQRFLLKLSGVCTVLLPLATIAWVAYEVFESFYVSAKMGTPYLGTNFAIHSILLIGISWLLPWFLYRKLRPSAEKVAHNALKSGITMGLELLKAKIDDVLLKLLDQRQRFQLQGQALFTQCVSPTPYDNVNDDGTLNRMLPESQSIPSITVGN